MTSLRSQSAPASDESSISTSFRYRFDNSFLNIRWWICFFEVRCPDGRTPLEQTRVVVFNYRPTNWAWEKSGGNSSYSGDCNSPALCLRAEGEETEGRKGRRGEGGIARDGRGRVGLAGFF